MIPFEELSRALDAYAGRLATDHTNENRLPAAAVDAVVADEPTSTEAAEVYDDRSNEIEIGDVISDDTQHH